MSKFMNIVRYRVKSDCLDDFIQKIKEPSSFEGLISMRYIRTEDNNFYVIGEWESKEALDNARPVLVKTLLDPTRHMLEELSSELGVTDPTSGEIIHEQ